MYHQKTLWVQDHQLTYAKLPTRWAETDHDPIARRNEAIVTIRPLFELKRANRARLIMSRHLILYTGYLGISSEDKGRICQGRYVVS